MDLDMSVPVPSVLFGMGGKCVLNWALVLLQKGHVWRSFVCVFGLSLAVADTALALAVTLIHLQGDCSVLGLRLTRHHVCLLVQMLGFVYGAQHVAVLLLSALEHLCVVARPSWKPSWILRLVLTVLLWVCSVFYVFNLSEERLYLEDVAHFQIDHCWMASSSVVSELAVVIGCLCLFWIVLHLLKLLLLLARAPYCDYWMSLRSQIQLRVRFVRKVLWMFLDPWVLFLVFLFILVVVPVEMPSHLALNCTWLCFVNSLLIALALCAVSPAAALAHGSAAVPPDSFCDWRTEISLATGVSHRFTARERRK